jgi:uncharacterized Zn finger protein (UPF0148 family)
MFVAVTTEPKMKTRDLNPELQTEDKAGNNIALTCPVCRKVYIVSEFIHGGERACPKCNKSKGLVKGDKAQIYWESAESSINAESEKEYDKWENYRITQLSFSINLFLGFAFASLAFAVSIKLKNELNGTMPIETIIDCWAFSAVLGCIATISRLLDFRHTALEIIYEGTFNRFMKDHLGDVSWGCFWGQVITYAFGAYLFIGV